GKGNGVQLTYGTRLEAARFSGAPAFNPAMDSLFGMRTDRIPSEVHVSPRIGFTWTLGGRGGVGPGGPTGTIVRGGVGDFRSLTPTTLYAAALAAPGLSNAEAQLVCVGSAVPTPDWTQYTQDPASIPSQCVDTATAVTISPDLQSDSRQLTLGFGGFTSRGATFQLSYTLTRARDQSSFSCCAATQGFAAPSTAGDPNVGEWATSGFERRHSFLGTVTYP